MPCENPVWKNASRVSRYLWTIGMGVVLAAALPGCFAHARGELVYDQPVEYVDTVPERIEYYPRTYYRGHPAYLVDGRWYYPHNRRWVVFREEPVELRQYRTRHAPAYSDPGPRYATQSKSLSPRRAERRAEERRIEERRAEARGRDERRAEQRRSEERRASERRAETRRDEGRRAAERHADVRRIDDHGGTEGRASTERHVAERKARQRRKGEKDRRDRKDERSDRDRRRDRD
jgi:hypothetical protein